MNEKIMNITSDGKVICDQFDMTFKDFFELMIDQTINNYELYHFDFDIMKECYFATYKGVKYIVKHDNKNLNEIQDFNQLTNHMDVEYLSTSTFFRNYYHKDDDLDKLVAVSAKSDRIESFKRSIKECEKQCKFFDKSKFLGLSTLNLSGILSEKIKKADIAFSFVFFAISFLCFTISLFSLQFNFVYLIFIPALSKLIYDLKALDDDKKNTFLSYLLHPLLFLYSKRKSKRDIEYYTEELEFYKKNVREYAKLAKDDFGKEKDIEEVDEDKLSEAAKAARELLRREKPEEKIEEESRGIQKRLKR